MLWPFLWTSLGCKYFCLLSVLLQKWFMKCFFFQLLISYISNSIMKFKIKHFWRFDYLFAIQIDVVFDIWIFFRHFYFVWSNALMLNFCIPGISDVLEFSWTLELIMVFCLFVFRLLVTHCSWKLVQWCGLQEFGISDNVLEIIYGQTICWIGTFFSPLLPAIATIKYFIIFYVKKVMKVW